MEMDFGICTKGGALSARAVTQSTDIAPFVVAKATANRLPGPTKHNKKLEAKLRDMALVLELCRGKLAKKVTA